MVTKALTHLLFTRSMTAAHWRSRTLVFGCVMTPALAPTTCTVSTETWQCLLLSLSATVTWVPATVLVPTAFRLVDSSIITVAHFLGVENPQWFSPLEEVLNYLRWSPPLALLIRKWSESRGHNWVCFEKLSLLNFHRSFASSKWPMTSAAARMSSSSTMPIWSSLSRTGPTPSICQSYLTANPAPTSVRMRKDCMGLDKPLGYKYKNCSPDVTYLFYTNNNAPVLDLQVFICSNSNSTSHIGTGWVCMSWLVMTCSDDACFAQLYCTCIISVQSSKTNVNCYY